MLEQVEIDARKTSRDIESKNTESKIIIRVENRKRDEVNYTWKSNKYNMEIKITASRNDILKNKKISIQTSERLRAKSEK